MPGSLLRFEAEYDFAPEIVWDALVDPDLVSGWLAEADIEPRIGGRYDLDWSHFDVVRATAGEIADLVDCRLLVVETDSFGTVTLTLSPRDSGSRLTVEIAADTEPAFTPLISATWRLSLEQLDELLRGRPVDWGSWRSQRAGRWHALHERAVDGR